MPDRWFEKGNSTGPAAEVGMARDPATLGRTSPSLEPPTRNGRGADLFVWSVWAMVFIAAMGLLWKYAVNLPALEDWELVAYLTGDEPVTLFSLWRQSGEHRRPLMFIVYLALLKLTGGNFQAPLYFNVISMAGLASAMIWAARRLRGGTTYTDAFFPLILLNVQFLPMATYRGALISYILPTLVAGVILLIIAVKGIRLTIGTTVLAGTCLILLPLCSAIGLTYMPFLILWFGYSGVVAWRAREHHGTLIGLLMCAFMSSALLLVCLYFVHFENRSLTAHSPNVWVTLRTGVRFLTGSFGSGAAAPIWPYSGIGMVVLMISGIATLFTVVVLPRQAQDRSRAVALLMFLGAVFTLALAMGWGRGGHGEFLDVMNYTTLSVLALCCLCFVFMIHRKPKIGSLFQCGLLTLIAIAIPLNFQQGLADARTHHSAMQSFELDMLNGAATYELMGRYASSHFGIGAHTWLAGSMLSLRRAGIGPFVQLKEDPVMREVRIPLTPADLKEIKWEDRTGHGTGPDSYLMFALPKPTFVAGIRIRWSHSNGKTTFFRAFWRRSDRSDFPDDYQYYWSFGLEDPLTIYIADTIDQIRIHPDVKPVDFTISEITLLIPSTN
jgi:hypothetical protein